MIIMDGKICNGATLWARQTIDSEIFFYKPDKWFKMWFYIVNKVNHKDTNLFKRGTNLITYGEIMSSTKATKNQVDKLIRFLKKTEMATTRKTTRGMVITICNYDKYQNIETYKSDKLDDLQTKRRRNADDTINNNERMKECNNIYTHFCSKINPLKKSSMRAKENISHYLKKYTEEELMKCADNYFLVSQHSEPKYRKDPANFYGKNEPYFKDYLPDIFSMPKISNGDKQEPQVGTCRSCKRTNITLNQNGLCRDCARGK